MSDHVNSFDLPDDLEASAPQSPEMRALVARLRTDGRVWQSRLPDTGHVAERIRAIPRTESVAVAEEHEATPSEDESVQEGERHTPPITPRPPQSPPPGPGTRLFGLVAAVVIVALIGAVLAQLAGHAGKNSGPAATSTPNASPTATDSTRDSTPSPSASPNVVPTGTTASGGAPGGTATTTPLVVTGMQLVMTDQSYSGVCSEMMTYHFDLTITVGSDPSGGDVAFNWIFSGGTDTYTSPPPNQLTSTWPSGAFTQAASVHFDADETSKTVPFQLPLIALYGDGKLMWLQAQATSPNQISSPQVAFSLRCATEITGITAVASPDSWSTDCTSSQHVTFTFVITVTPAPPYTLYITSRFSSGFSDWTPPGPMEWPYLVSYPQPNVTTTFTGGNDLPGTAPNGTYWKQISLAWSENGTPFTQSPQATITKSC